MSVGVVRYHLSVVLFHARETTTARRERDSLFFSSSLQKSNECPFADTLSSISLNASLRIMLSVPFQVQKHTMPLT